MIVISDTGPIHYLVLIGEVEVLPALYVRVVVPESVCTELRHSQAPNAIRAWIASPPSWLEVWPDPPSDSGLEFLDAGERAAISLAQIVGADELLVDDYAGRREAERRHIRVTGTLGVLADAHLTGLLQFDVALSKLLQTNFRISRDVERRVRGRIYEEERSGR
jgi:hypothetical protein